MCMRGSGRADGTGSSWKRARGTPQALLSSSAKADDPVFQKQSCLNRKAAAYRIARSSRAMTGELHNQPRVIMARDRQPPQLARRAAADVNGQIMFRAALGVDFDQDLACRARLGCQAPPQCGLACRAQAPRAL